jgi:hypothetical protein
MVARLVRAVARPSATTVANTIPPPNATSVVVLVALVGVLGCGIRRRLFFADERRSLLCASDELFVGIGCEVPTKKDDDLE